MTEQTTVDQVDPPRSPKDIRRWRLERGLTLDKFAREMGVSPQTLDKVEKEEPTLTLKPRIKIAEYFDGLPELEASEVTILTIWPELLEDKAA